MVDILFTSTRRHCEEPRTGAARQSTFRAVDCFVALQAPRKDDGRGQANTTK